jgi:hypothetical protein
MAIVILLLISNVIILITVVIYNEKISDADKIKASERLERRRASFNKILNKIRKRRVRRRFKDTQIFLNVKKKIYEINDSKNFTDEEKNEKIQKLIDDLRSL